MKTLKAFILKNKEFQGVATQTPNLSNSSLQIADQTLQHKDEFNVIENETVTSRDFNGLTISGSLFSLTTFVDVSFNSCTFFATRIENCTFINCEFKNCTFEFSNCTFNKFEECNFENDFISYSPFKNNIFYNSSLPLNLYKNFKVNNELTNTLQTIPFSSQEETKTLLQSIILKKFVA